MDIDSTISKPERSSEGHPPEPGSVPTSAAVLTSPPTTNYAGFADLPTELYLDIFKPLRPTFTVTSPIEQKEDHRKAVKQYADLRLICSRLNDTLTPVIYSETVVYIRDKTRPAELARTFECRADHIRRLIIVGEDDRQLCHCAEVTQAIGRGLRLCSQVESLECYGTHRIFVNRQWPGRVAPNLASTVTSLVFQPNRSAVGDLSYSLLGLGAHLRSLEICGWVGGSERSTFHLPSKMPHLTNLSLRDGYPRLEDVKKLITRATQKKTLKDAGALRSLVISNISGIGAAEIKAILSIHNLHSQLTVLHWHPSRDFQDVTSVVKDCPNLVDFSYTGAVIKELFHHLPPALEHLELLYNKYYPRMLSSGDDFVMFLRSGRCQALRTLQVIMKMDGFHCHGVVHDFDSAFIAATCDDVGVTLNLRVVGRHANQ
jgi:hypothetical protein